MVREAKVVETPENDSDVYIPDDSMMMMNEGQAFYDDAVEEEVKEQIAEDHIMFQGNEALIQAVFDWMDNEILATDSIKTARAIAKEYSVTLEHALITCDVVAKLIEGKKVQFQNIYDSIKANETNTNTEISS